MRKLYPEYRESGIPWLGQIPIHWEVKRLKWSLKSVVNGVWGDEPDGENDIACVRVADFDRQRFQVRIAEPTIRSVEPSQRAGRELRSGDLLIEKSGGGEKQIVGAVVHYDHCLPAVSSNFVGRITIREDNAPRFWAYVHAMLYAGKLTYPAIKQTTGIQNLDTDAYFSTEVGFPPHDEQRAIAAFLDRETARIDQLITKHELLIERLAEYRNAVITQTVTKGLPPNAAHAAGLDPEYRESGIPWLGQIPIHWEVKRLKWSLKSVVNGVWGDEPDGENDIACVRVADFDRQRFQVRIAEPTIRSVEPSQRAGRELRSGDLLIEKSGGGEKQIVGAVVHYDHCLPAVSSNFVGRITIREDNAPRFWAYVHAMLYAGKLTYPAIKQTTGIQNLDTDAYFSTEVGFPPHDEQRAIAAFLDRETARIDTLSERAETAIERLNEYRTALITAAVTGKIDLRESDVVEEPKE